MYVANTNMRCDWVQVDRDDDFSGAGKGIMMDRYICWIKGPNGISIKARSWLVGILDFC